jgi:3-hydroxybutyryl-CoA dehydrogenase
MEPWQVTVIGAGIMGRGIAEWLASSGHDVVIYDLYQPAAAQMAGENNDGTGVIRHVTSLAEAVYGRTLIVEAVVEDLDIKHQVLKSVEESNENGIIASTTSTFMPSTLAKVLRHPDRLIVTHFFNPAAYVPLVEVVVSPQTDNRVVEKLLALFRSAGKLPVLLGGEIPGFVANRLQAAVLREALSLVRSGVASYHQIDEVMTTGLGPRWSVVGPFKTADLGGLDTFRALSEQLFPLLDNSTEPAPELCQLVALGHLGAKTGQGFYQETQSEVDEIRIRVQSVFNTALAL